jgi:hypothetical protein
MRPGQPDPGSRIRNSGSDSVTIVNVLQKVLTHYFGAELSPRPMPSTCCRSERPIGS